MYCDGRAHHQIKATAILQTGAGAVLYGAKTIRPMSLTFARPERPVCGNWYGRTLAIARLDSLVVEQIARIVDHCS
ncbi:hypothetical protein BQ8482_220108 [Mesorhizobium delmotii]|uniref:Uncharacterized protein n=1 Tax=Mesorhizobium delmotii TaxID=1631247 RepID=A0A2P9ALE6_9HYPH|nr:hypothetical protein BQ8482_220108 [Mesorhizobium delmotii]